MDVLQEMPKVSNLFDLTSETLPHVSTVCTRKQEIPMRRWRAVLDSSVDLDDLGDVQAIDATGVDRVQSSQHYAKRTEYTFEAIKPTLLVHCETSMNLYIHCSMKQPHYTQVGWQVLVRNVDVFGTAAVDMDYDWEELRTRLRAESITTLIPQQDPGMCGWARHLLNRDRAYNQRSNAESVFLISVADTKTRSGREPGSANYVNLLLKSAVRNIEHALEGSNR